MAQLQPFDINGIRRRMKGAVQVLKEEFAGLRSGRASAHLLEPITVEAYGSQMPMTQVGTLSVPEPRMITVQVWDRSLVHAVDKAIRTSNLGLNPIVEGQTLRVPIPELSAERRKELSKVAHQYAEKARIAVRNVRRDGMEQLKRLDKDGNIGEDEHKSKSSEVQKATDETIKEIDAALAHKDSEIMQV